MSAVTFLAAVSFATLLGIPSEGFLPALVALLEVPAIVVGLLLATGLKGGSWRTALHEVLVGRSIVLLVGGLVIGFVVGARGMEGVKPFSSAVMSMRRPLTTSTDALPADEGPWLPPIGVVAVAPWADAAPFPGSGLADPRLQAAEPMANTAAHMPTPNCTPFIRLLRCSIRRSCRRSIAAPVLEGEDRLLGRTSPQTDAPCPSSLSYRRA